jgi:hypothetical protein
MTIPWDWLLCRTTPTEVEADLAELGAPDIWLLRWRALLDRMAPGDELWRYFKVESVPTMEGTTEEIAGFEPIRDAETLARLGLLDRFDRIDRDHSGYAVVRGDEIIDWIEEPP